MRGAPTSFLQLPDGRFVASFQSQIAIGDGSRWDVFEMADTETSTGITTVIADEAGNLVHAEMPEDAPQGVARLH